MVITEKKNMHHKECQHIWDTLQTKERHSAIIDSMITTLGCEPIYEDI